MQTLQFYSAGHIGKDIRNHLLQKGKRRKRTGDNLKEFGSQMDEDSFFNNDKKEVNKNTKLKLRVEKEKKPNNKDFCLKIFHAAGKFLYNKRVDPLTNKARIMTSKELMSNPKPISYINHEDILNEVNTESNFFTLLLKENMYDLFEDIEDISKVLEVYSDNDRLSTIQSYSYDYSKYYYEINQHCAHTECLAITEYNIHGGDRKGKKTMKKMNKSPWFDMKRQIAEGKTEIFDVAKLEQIRNGEIISEDLLMSPINKIVSDYLPYLKNIGFLRSHKIFNPLLEYTHFSKQKLGHQELADETELINDEKEKKFQENLKNRKMAQQKQDKNRKSKDGFARYQQKEENGHTIIEEEIEDSDEIDEEDILDWINDISDDGIDSISN